MVNCGHIYFLNLQLAGKPKLLVPAFIVPDGRVRFFVIGTNRTEYQQNTPEVAKHVLALPKKGHETCLTHDSWLACHEVVGGWRIGEIEAVANCYRCPLDAAMVVAVRVLILDTRLHSEIDKAAILSQWPK